MPLFEQKICHLMTFSWQLQSERMGGKSNSQFNTQGYFQRYSWCERQKGNLCGINNSSNRLSAFAVSLTSAECGLGVCTSHCSQSSAQTLLLQGLGSLLKFSFINLRLELLVFSHAYDWYFDLLHIFEILTAQHCS